MEDHIDRLKFYIKQVQSLYRAQPVGLTFRFPRLVTFRFPRLVMTFSLYLQFKTEVQRKCLKTEVQRKCLKTEVQRKCLFKCWVNIQVPSFGQPIKCSNSKQGDRDYVSTIKLGYRENVSSSVWLTFRSPSLVTFRFPSLVNQSNVSKNHVNQSVSLFEKSA